MSMTFLQLAQFVAAKCGTVGTVVSSVEGQSGRLKKVVDCTAQAWALIQTDQANWRWMRKEFTKATIVNTARYTGAALGLTDFARWIVNDDTFSVYSSTLGVSDETGLTKMSWTDYRLTYGRGTQTPAKPSRFAISPANELCLGAIPDAAYVLKGEYYSKAQELTANGDVPNLPEDYHLLIGWRGLLLLAEFDEAVTQISVAQSETARLSAMLALTQLDQVEFAPEPLA